MRAVLVCAVLHDMLVCTVLIRAMLVRAVLVRDVPLRALLMRTVLVRSVLVRAARVCADVHAMLLCAWHALVYRAHAYRARPATRCISL